MNKTRAQHDPTATLEKTAAAGRVFKFSLKGVPVVDAAMEAQLRAAAQNPGKDRRYPVMMEVPDS